MFKKALILLVLGCLLLFASSKVNAESEISINAGYAFPQLSSTTSYSDQWSWIWLDSVSESGSIKLEAKNSFTAGLGYTYFFPNDLGIQAKLDYLKADVDSNSNYTATWTWVDGSTYSESYSATDSGTLTLTPISLNVVKRFKGEKVSPYISGGPTYFMGNFKAEGTGWVADSIWGGSWQIIDFFPAMAFIDESINTFGLNLGGGINFKVSENVSINLDGRYFYGKEKTYKWKVKAGTYTSEGYEIPYTLPEYETDDEAKVNPSFFRLALGITLAL